MNEGEEVRKGKSVFRSVILLMAVVFVVMAGNIGIYAAQAEKVNGNDTTEMANPTVTPNPDITTPIITPEVTPIVKKGLLKEGNSYRYYINGKMVTNTWKKVKNHYYWFKSNGKAAANGYYKVKGVYYVFDEKARRLSPAKKAVVKVKNISYFVDTKGRAVKGWNEYKNKMYYSYSNGKCAVNTKIDGIKFNKNGAADLTQAREMLEAKKFIAAHTTKNMNNYQKLRACFNYIMWYTRYTPWKRPTEAEFKTQTWVYKYALDMFQTNLTGNCYGVASCLAAVAKELGYEPYVITALEDHAFVMINGLYYDNMYGTLFGSPTHPYYHLRQKIRF